jgi:hypothetical protein
MNGPILITSNFTKQFKLAVDASDVGVSDKQLSTMK